MKLEVNQDAKPSVLLGHFANNSTERITFGREIGAAKEVGDGFYKGQKFSAAGGRRGPIFWLPAEEALFGYLYGCPRSVPGLHNAVVGGGSGRLVPAEKC